MPARCSVRPLRLSCMRTIAAHYDLLCYGCRTRHQMAALLEAEAEQGPGYQDFPGPFTSLPASLVEDLVTVMYLIITFHCPCLFNSAFSV